MQKLFDTVFENVEKLFNIINEMQTEIDRLTKIIDEYEKLNMKGDEQ